MRRKCVEIDTTAVRALAVRIAELLPEQPLDGHERYREEPTATSIQDPVRAYVELDAGGRDLRRIEVYADGRMDYAVRAIELEPLACAASQPRVRRVSSFRKSASRAFGSQQSTSRSLGVRSVSLTIPSRDIARR